MRMGLRRRYIGFCTRRLSMKCVVAGVLASVIAIYLLNGVYTRGLGSNSNLGLPAWSRRAGKADARSGTANGTRASRRQTPRPSKKFAILGEMAVLDVWLELAEMRRCFLEPSSNTTRPCRVSCPAHGTGIELVLTDNVGGFNGSDAAVFGLSPKTLLKNVKELLRYSRRIPPTQTAVLYSMETPLRVHKWIHRVGDLLYNVDLTYLPSADVDVPYAYYKAGSSENALESKANHAEGKTGLIAWMGSNCVKEVYWPRMRFVQELGRHLPLDTYGKCGNLTCLPRLSAKCVNLIGSYKFYLALENSECHYYMTEKVWMSSLLNGVVPVVYGAPREDFERVAPPNSFIHVSDFDSVRELASYILRVDRSDELYNAFFEWRRHGSVIMTYPFMRPSYFCRLLPFLQGNRGMSGAKKIKHSKWFTSCRGNITRRFHISQVPTLSAWKPWRPGVNDYKRGY